MSREALEEQLEILEGQDTGYQSATLRLILTLALAAALFSLAGIVVKCVEK